MQALEAWTVKDLAKRSGVVDWSEQKRKREGDKKEREMEIERKEGGDSKKRVKKKGKGE